MNMKATACAHPVQNLITPLPFSELLVQVPFLCSISVCTAPLETEATVEFLEEGDVREVTFKGCPVDWRVQRGVDAVISEVKRLSGIESEYAVWGTSNFLKDVGPDEPSFVAAVTAASSRAAGLELCHKELSRIAAKGSGAAPAAVTGWVSKWVTSLQEEFSHSVVIEEDLEIGMIRVFVDRVVIDLEMVKPPFVEARLKVAYTSVAEMERAIKNHDVERIGELAEKDALLLHAAAAAGRDQVVWSPEVLKVLNEVRAMREERVKAYFNADWTGVYINSYPEDAAAIERRISSMGVETCSLYVGGNAQSRMD
jgi:mevalonate pyrophosphate decarboxylase